MAKFYFNIGALGVELCVSEPQAVDEQIRFSGAYRFDPPCLHEIGLRICIERIPGFEQDRAPTSKYPQFHTTHFSSTELRIARQDAEGVIEIREDGPLVAKFVTGLATPTIEGIIRVCASLALLQVDALILHSSAIADREGAHVFSGISGAGKSTIAALLHEALPVRRLADELLLVSRTEAGWELIVAPFAGKVPLPLGERAALKTINFLIQSPNNERTRLGTAQALREMSRHVLTYSRSPASNAKVLELLDGLVSSVPCFELRFARSASVGEVLGLTC